MAGRFLPQKDIDLITRVTKELVGDKKNNKDGIINQTVVIYKPFLQESRLVKVKVVESLTSMELRWLVW